MTDVYTRLGGFSSDHRGPALGDGAGGSSERPQSRVEDPVIRTIGWKTNDFTLADDAEYDLDGVAYGDYEASWLNDQRPSKARFSVAAMAAIATSALVRSTTVLTATVASGATEGLQVGMSVLIEDSDVAAYNGVHTVASTTATTVTFAVANSGSTDDGGVASLVPTVAVFAKAAEEIVLWDSIIAADNQSENLGALQRGIYTVISNGFHESFYSTGAALLQYAQNVTGAGPIDVTHDEADDATSDSVTALFESSSDVILRNGADVATALTVLFRPMEHVGIDQDGLVCLYCKRDSATDKPSLRLKNRLGASKVFSLERIR